MRDIIKNILREGIVDDKKSKIDFYTEYYKNLTPSNLKVVKEGDKIVITGFEDEVQKIEYNFFIKL